MILGAELVARRPSAAAPAAWFSACRAFEPARRGPSWTAQANPCAWRSRTTPRASLRYPLPIACAALSQSHACRARFWSSSACSRSSSCSTPRVSQVSRWSWPSAFAWPLPSPYDSLLFVRSDVPGSHLTTRWNGQLTTRDHQREPANDGKATISSLPRCRHVLRRAQARQCRTWGSGQPIR